MTVPDLRAAKAVLREALLRQKREEKNAPFRGEADRQIAAHVLALPAFRRARRVLLYASTSLEVDTDQLLREAISLGKEVWLPVSLPEGQMAFGRVYAFDELVCGRFGIRSPSADAEKLDNFTDDDFCLVPAVAYGRDLSRLGRGGGYYDRFLMSFPGIRVGCVYDRYLFCEIPKEEHDCPVDAVITEKGVWPHAV